ncbi:MAG: ABC transporter substrate-binding protein [Deltaproteobacteria bacterium]|nr:ABC transporter substrate-binding protein [Deltaproteobacteria bacterium]MDL1961370.1 ABC transporter substrate-binding protein [Deltaproteobacteria bacterium]
MILVGWLSDLSAIASSGEAGGIAQKAISYHRPLPVQPKLCGYQLDFVMLNCCPIPEKSAVLLKSIAVICTVAVALITGAAAAQSNGPATVVEKFNAKLLEAMQGGEKLGYAGRYALLEPVIYDVFAFDLMARISSGKYWQSMSADQRDRLIELYRQWSTATYARRFDTFAGQRFEVSAPPQALGSRVNVCSHMIKSNGEVILFLYKLKMTRHQWRIVDIHVKGVSQLANTRAQFTSILDRDGYEVLLKTLQEKIDDLSS